MWASYGEALHESAVVSRQKELLHAYRPKPTTSATTRCRSRIALPSMRSGTDSTLNCEMFSPLHTSLLPCPITFTVANP